MGWKGGKLCAVMGGVTGDIRAPRGERIGEVGEWAGDVGIDRGEWMLRPACDWPIEPASPVGEWEGRDLLGPGAAGGGGADADATGDFCLTGDEWPDELFDEDDDEDEFELEDGDATMGEFEMETDDGAGFGESRLMTAGLLSDNVVADIGAGLPHSVSLSESSSSELTVKSITSILGFFAGDAV